MSKPRRRHTAEQKAELLRQHVAEKKPVSEVCNEAEIQAGDDKRRFSYPNRMLMVLADGRSACAGAARFGRLGGVAIGWEGERTQAWCRVEDWERQRIIDYFDCHPLDGYRRLTFMLDEDVVALSPSTTYRVLSKAGRLDRWNGKPSKKGTGFVQPLDRTSTGIRISRT